jgi:hypothetical protein
MSSNELNVLRELSTTNVKPPKDVISNLGVANSTNYDTRRATTLAPAQTQKFSNVEPESQPPAPTTEVKSQPKVTVTTPAKEVEKFGYNLVGAIPNGYGPAQACGNCAYDDYGGCKLHSFPNHHLYSCGDFELKPVKTTEYFEKPKEAQSLEPLETGSKDSSISKAAEAYEPILEKFSDGDLASEALDVVVQRFSTRSAYADEFLKLRYRRAYESKHGNLDNAFLE